MTFLSTHPCSPEEAIHKLTETSKSKPRTCFLSASSVDANITLKKFVIQNIVISKCEVLLVKWDYAWKVLIPTSD